MLYYTYIKVYKKGDNMLRTVGIREMQKNISMFSSVGVDEYLAVEDKKTHKTLGYFIPEAMGRDFISWKESRDILSMFEDIKSINVNNDFSMFADVLGDEYAK
ncbi:MAG: hypothetical protein RL154_1511 [Pseudomonadota bacterium]|jgi:hypothetical protein